MLIRRTNCADPRLIPARCYHHLIVVKQRFCAFLRVNPVALVSVAQELRDALLNWLGDGGILALNDHQRDAVDE